MKYLIWIAIISLSACGGDPELITANDRLEPEFIEENENSDTAEGGFPSILEGYEPGPDLEIDFTDYSLDDFTGRNVSSDTLDGTWIAVGYYKNTSGFHHKKRIVFQIDTSKSYKMNDCYPGQIPANYSSITDKIFIDSFIFTPISNTSMSASINDESYGINSSYTDWDFTAIKISDNNTHTFITESLVIPAHNINKSHQFASCFVEGKIQSSHGNAHTFYSDEAGLDAESRNYSRGADSASLDSFFQASEGRTLYSSSTTYGFDVQMIVSKSDSSGIELYVNSNNNYSNDGIYKSKMTITIP